MRIDLRLKAHGFIASSNDAAVIADDIVKRHTVLFELRNKHPVVASRDDAELMPCCTPAGNALFCLCVNPSAAQKGSIVITCCYLHPTSSS